MSMRIRCIVFVTSVYDEPNEQNTQTLMKTYESNVRPVAGDIIDDPGFDSRFHNGYEVAKVTLNYSDDECLVSLAPLVTDRETMPAKDYIDQLKMTGWKVLEQ
ncbi:hypothetical protein JCM19039_4693 [Geomicrobium sp. JCM 19039]|nr:hypothetical protein JCM19039_4693 [Geomicrobium sp. JCM 19039]